MKNACNIFLLSPAVRIRYHMAYYTKWSNMFDVIRCATAAKEIKTKLM